MKLVYTTQFKKDFKRVVKQLKDMNKFDSVVDSLLNNEKLRDKFNDHQLTGKWKNHRDCHIEPDWVLIYRISGDTITFERTGSHSELFK